MEPSHLIPNPDVFPAPWWLFNVLLVITFTLHLLTTNVMLGAGFAALWAHFWKGGTGGMVGREAARRFPLTIALSVNLGVAPLLFLQVLYGNFIYVSYVLMAVYWVSLFVLIMLAYYSAYVLHYRYERLGAGRVRLLVISLVLLLTVGFYFTNSLLLMIDPKAWFGYFQHPSGTIIHWREQTLITRYLHFVMSSLAVAGLGMGLFGWWCAKKNDSSGETLMRRGLYLYACTTILQFLVGAWYLGALPNQVLAKAAFESKLVFPLFLISIMTGLVSILFSFGQRPWHAAASFLVTVVLMVVFRYSVRSRYLEDYLALHRPEVVTQVGPLLMFVLALLLGVAVVVYVLKLVLQAGKESRP